MIEEIVLDYLEEALDVPAFMEKPAKDTPAEYFVIEKTSGGRTNLIDTATIAVQSYAETLYDAAVLNDRMKKAMFEIESLPEVSACTLNSDYNFTDTATKSYRYQAVFDITYYG